MKKYQKRIVAIFSMLMVLLAMVPQNVSAKEVDKRIAVNVQVPEDWAEPCVWAWDEDGNNAFEAWPGGETEATPDNDGWSYIWLPDWANHVIVNANAGEVQTQEIVLEAGKDAWITVASPEEATVSYEAKTQGTTPEYVEKFAVHAKVDDSWTNPCLWAWSAPDGTNAFDAWPGKEMKASDTGWYTGNVPVWVNSIIVNGNEGSVQTEDLTVDAAELWVTVDAEGKAELSYKDPDKAEVANVTVHVKAPSDWSNPCLWAWSAPDGTNAFAAWPGEALEESDGWLVKEIPGWVNSIIVNGNDGSVQTSDLSVETGKDLWVVVKDAENAEVSYEAPVVEETAEEAAPAEEIATEEPSADSATAEADNHTLIYVVAGLAVLLIVVAVIVVVNKKKH